MFRRELLARLGIGIGVLLGVLAVGFLVTGSLIPTWGATGAEVARTLPGDELLNDPIVNWTHAITIDAPRDRVWGWIAQLGERRGAFYSFTFIENQMGNGDVYHNSDRIVAEWQNPAPGLALIGGASPLKVYQVIPASSLVAFQDGAFQWLWGWHLEPLNSNQTRLLVRMRIHVEGMENPVIGSVLNFGGFVMEQGMLQGIKQRAEGNIPPPYSETLEIILWVLAALAGLIAAVFFLMFQKWLAPLGIGVLAVIVLFVFTFWQPPVWTRVLADAILFGGLALLAMDRWLTSPDTRAHQRGKRQIPAESFRS